MSRSLFVYVMIPFLGFLAVIQTVVGPRLSILNVRPDLILVFVIAWTLVYGPRQGLVLAFIGGLWMDIFSGGPMGGSSLALMIAAVIAGVGHQALFRSNLIVPTLVGVAGTLGYAAAYLAVLAAIGHDLPWQNTVERLVLPEVLYNGALMLILTPLLNRIPEPREVG